LLASSSSPWWDNDLQAQPTDERMLEKQEREEIATAQEDDQSVTTPDSTDNDNSIDDLEADRICYMPFGCVQWYFNFGFLDKDES
jgi:hypothetical protein